MMKLKRFGALLAAIAMIALAGAAFASGQTLEDGVVGAFTTVDTPNVNDKVLNLKKEIKAFNPEGKNVYGPAITYTYEVTPAANLYDITDAPAKHASGESTKVTAIAGVTTGLTVNGGTAGSASSASGTVAWVNTDILETTAAGTANTKDITLNFTNVIFPEPGVYRYLITETAATRVTSGVTSPTGYVATRYLDVYVMRSDAYDDSDGIQAADMRVYGYVCMIDNEEITATGDTATTGAAKTNGFVTSTNDSTAVPADEYHTYNLTVSKVLTGDATMNSHKFPFDVAWTAGDATGNFQFAVEASDSTSAVTKTAQAAGSTVNGTEVAANSMYKVGSADAVGTADKDGTPSIANGGSITYIGIPATTKFAVTETNDVAGTTYSTTLKVDDTATAFTGGTATMNTGSTTATMATNNTAIYGPTTAPTIDTDVEVEYTNALALISPTGYVARFAPYALMLIGGVALLLIATKHRKHTEDEEK